MDAFPFPSSNTLPRLQHRQPSTPQKYKRFNKLKKKCCCLVRALRTGLLEGARKRKREAEKCHPTRKENVLSESRASRADDGGAFK